MLRDGAIIRQRTLRCHPCWPANRIGNPSLQCNQFVQCWESASTGSDLDGVRRGEWVGRFRSYIVSGTQPGSRLKPSSPRMAGRCRLVAAPNLFRAAGCTWVNHLQDQDDRLRPLCCCMRSLHVPRYLSNRENGSQRSYPTLRRRQRAPTG